MLPYERNTVMPRSVSLRVMAAGTDDPPRPAYFMCGRCSGVKSGVIEQAGDVVGGTAADGQIVAEHQRQGLTGIPGVGGLIAVASMTGIRNALIMPMKCPTGAAVSCRPRSARYIAASCRFRDRANSDCAEHLWDCWWSRR